MEIETKGGQYLRIEAEIQIDAPPERVFKALTSGLDGWWPHRTNEEAKIVFEAKPGGMLYEDHGSGKFITYGIVATYNPPYKLVTLDVSGWGQGAYDARNIEIVEPDGNGGSLYKKTLILWGVIPSEVAEMFDGGVQSLQAELKRHIEAK